MSNVKKYPRTNIGSIIKSPDPKKSDYIKIRTDLKEAIVLNAGDFIQVETPQFQLASLERGLEEGKLTAEYVEKQRERIEAGIAKRKAMSADGKTDFVRADLVVINK